MGLVLELQADDATELPTVLVAPLVYPDELAPIPGFTPLIEVDGEKLALRVDHMAGIPRERLGAKVGNLLDQEYRITRAVERLLFRS